MRFSHKVTVFCDGEGCACKAETEAFVRVLNESTSTKVRAPTGWKILRRVAGVLSHPTAPKIPSGLYYFCFECHQKQDPSKGPNPADSSG